MPRWSIALLVCLIASALSACGGAGREPLSPACREGSASVRTALRDAPRTVTLDGEPLSGCLRSARDGGDLSEVGMGFLDAAAQLAPAAVKAPEGPEALQLGYLVGAARRGVPGEQGPSAELVRRLTNEATQVDTSSAAYRRGLRAGSRTG